MSDERVSDESLMAIRAKETDSLVVSIARECQHHRQRERAYAGNSDTPLTDSELIEIYDGDEYPPGSLAVRLAGECIRGRERERELREVVGFVGHKEPCALGIPIGADPHTGEQLLAECSCGFDALLEKYPWLRQLIQEVRG